jgi:hypothetical protein
VSTPGLGVPKLRATQGPNFFHAPAAVRLLGRNVLDGLGAPFWVLLVYVRGRLL